MLKLTEKQNSFCEEYVLNGYNGGKAYKIAFKNDNDNTCRVGAHNLLHNPAIIEKIKEIEGNYKILGLEKGINKKKIIEKIQTMLNSTKKTFHQGNLIDESPDANAINNAIITWTKLTGEFETEKKAITFNSPGLDKDPSKMTKEEQEKLKTEILKDL